jgi:hypothetical protein
MIGSFSTLGFQHASDPVAARQVILKAFKRARCHYREAAEKYLSINPATLRRIIAKDDQLAAAMARMEAQAKKEGWHHGRTGGWPLGRKRGPRSKEAAA